MNRSYVNWLCFLTFLCYVEAARTLYYVTETDPLDQYLLARKSILGQERKESVGGKMVLDTKEQSVNKILMSKKNDEVMNSLKGGQPYPPSLHFFHAKPLIEKSDVFKIIQMMPKGGALHLHDVSAACVEWLVKNVTYRENCYMCCKKGSRVQFTFSDKKPQSADCSWTLVKDNRDESGNPNLFDQWIYNNLSLIVSDPEKTYPTEDAVWAAFEAALMVANGLVWHTPVLRDYVYQCLQEYNDDNVQYMEIRTLMTQTYELNGSKNPEIQTLDIYRNVSRQFVADHKGSFSGAKLIYSDRRILECSEIAAGLKKATGWWTTFPDFMVGYDLVGQEDKGHPLIYCIKELLRNNTSGKPLMPYFFHAGETNWQDTSVDENLIDAVLLNTTRIGHGYALLKHLWALGEVKARGIAVEVNPISNQVLKLVDDLRNHPATVFLDSGLPVVISSDDGAVWGSKGLSHDFYQAFMGLSGLTSDLTLLKQLAINSIRYSAMSETEKNSATKLWTTKWDKFLDDILHEFA